MLDRAPPTSTRPFRRIAGFLAAWSAWIVLASILIAASYYGNQRTVTPAYREATANWIAGKPLYDGEGRAFLYFPPAAVLFAPFAALPHAWGEALWRLLGVAAFAAGVRCQAVAWTPAGSADSNFDSFGRERFFALASWALLPVVYKASFNGQSTVVMAGLMLWASARYVRGSNAGSALILAAACAFKPLAAVLALLLPTARPRMIPWSLAAAAGLFLFPFLTQAPGYVLDQWVEMREVYIDAERFGRQASYAHLFHTLRLVGVKFAPSWETGLRLAAALGVLGLTLLSVRRGPHSRAALEPYTLAICWLLLFSPRTEANTYALLAPSLGFEFAAAVTALSPRRLEAVFWGLAIAAVPASYDLARLTGTSPNTAWPAVLVAAVCLLVAASRLLLPTLHAAAEPDPAPHRPTWLKGPYRLRAEVPSDAAIEARTAGD